MGALWVSFQGQDEAGRTLFGDCDMSVERDIRTPGDIERVRAYVTAQLRERTGAVWKVVILNWKYLGG